MKKIFALLSAVITTLFVTAGAFAAGFRSEGDTVISAPTPFDKNYVSIDWNTSTGENVGVPIPYGEFVLLPTQNKVNKLSEKDGTSAAYAELDEKVSSSCRGVVTGSILIQPTRSGLAAIDLNKMEVLTKKSFGEISTDIAADDKFIYFGCKDGEKFRFICADITDFDVVWEYESDSELSSAAYIDGKITFISGDKLIIRNDNGFIENEIGAEALSVFAGKYAVFISCKNGELRKIRLDENGKTEDEIISLMLGGELTAAAGIDNHIYIGSTEGFFVVDGLNMEITEHFDDLKNSSAPVVTTGNGVRAYTAAPHTDQNGERWYLYSILDAEDSLTKNPVAKIIDFENGKTAVSVSGRMFFRDGKGQVWAISASKPNVFTIIVKIILLIAIFVMLLIILRTWAKKRQNKKPPQY